MGWLLGFAAAIVDFLVISRRYSVKCDSEGFY
jgi:hypothetical protein